MFVVGFWFVGLFACPPFAPPPTNNQNDNPTVEVEDPNTPQANGDDTTNVDDEKTPLSKGQQTSGNVLYVAGTLGVIVVIMAVVYLLKKKRNA